MYSELAEVVKKKWINKLKKHLSFNFGLKSHFDRSDTRTIRPESNWKKGLSEHRPLTCRLRYLNAIVCLILPGVWLLTLLCWILRCWHRKKQSCFKERLWNPWYLCSFLSRLKLYKTCIMHIHSQNCQQCKCWLMVFTQPTQKLIYCCLSGWRNSTQILSF